jgi:hypothetical protein
MKKSFDRFSGLLKAAALLLVLLLCASAAACAGNTGDDPGEKTPEATKAQTSEATEAPKATDAATVAPTPNPTEPPTEKPSVDPTANPYEGMPVPYFDLAFKKNDAYDALDNTELEVEDGSVEEVEVNLGGETYKVTGFRGTDDDDYMTIILDEYASDFRGFVEEGVSYEIFIQIDEIPASSGGLLISNGNGGGTNLAIRGSQGQLNFNVGSTAQDGTYPGSGYIYAQTNDASQGTKIEAGTLVHVVGIYDPEEGKVQLYYNGELSSEGEFGTGDFNMASTRSGVLGIAYNASFQNERLGNLTSFTIVEARVYRQPLTAEEVKAVYDNCVNAVKSAQN